GPEVVGLDGRRRRFSRTRGRGRSRGWRRCRSRCGRRQETISGREQAVILAVAFLFAPTGKPHGLIRLAELGPHHHSRSHIGGRNLSVHGAAADQRRGTERKESELLVYFAAIL